MSDWFWIKNGSSRRKDWVAQRVESGDTSGEFAIGSEYNHSSPPGNVGAWLSSPQPAKSVIELTEQERQQLQSIADDPDRPRRRKLRARILLAIDESPAGEGLNDRQAEVRLGVALSTIKHIRREYAAAGAITTATISPRHKAWPRP